MFPVLLYSDAVCVVVTQCEGYHPQPGVSSPQLGLCGGSVIMPHHSKQGPRNVDISQDIE